MLWCLLNKGGVCCCFIEKTVVFVFFIRYGFTKVLFTMLFLKIQVFSILILRPGNRLFLSFLKEILCFFSDHAIYVPTAKYMVR